MSQRIGAVSMIEAFDNDFAEQKLVVFIGEEEWESYSYQSKLKLLFRLNQSRSHIAKDIGQYISGFMKVEQDRRTIDIEATLEKAQEM